MDIQTYFKGWTKVIDLNELYNVVSKLQKYNINYLCPSYKDIFKAFNLCPYKDCKVVMLGMDPYPQKNVATGILFGNKKGTVLSPSLEVVKESCIDYTIPHNIIDFDETLESWASQGVLMLNSALTCQVNKPGSHTMLWRPFISKFLKNYSRKESGIIYVLFGSQAKTFKPYITGYNTILEVEHPAYFARINKSMPNIFKEINNLLYYKYKSNINWYYEN